MTKPPGATLQSKPAMPTSSEGIKGSHAYPVGTLSEISNFQQVTSLQRGQTSVSDLMKEIFSANAGGIVIKTDLETSQNSGKDWLKGTVRNYWTF